MEYTKGKWKYKRPSIETDNTKICIMEEPHYMPDCGDTTWYNGCVGTMKANARLISASPDLYEALKALQEHILVNVVVENDVIRSKLNKARLKAAEALAKAEQK